MTIGWQGRAPMAIRWQGRAIWPTEGTEDVGRNLELELKKFKLEQEHGPGPEQNHEHKSRSKPQSQSSASAQSWSPDHSPSSRVSSCQKPRDGRDVRRPGARKGGI